MSRRTHVVWLGFFAFFLNAATAHAGEWTKMYEARTYEDAQGDNLLYRLMRPRNYDPAQKYPLVVFLHGAGERGSDNEAQLKWGMEDFAAPHLREKYPCFVVAPQCPAEEKWVNVDWTLSSHSMPEKPANAMRLVFELIEQLRKEFSIDGERLYITGLSMGGYGAWDAIQRHPNLFAAAAPVCGGGDPAFAKRIAKLPIWAFHGDEDTAVKPQRSREMIEALKAAGGEPKYTEYAGVGHNSWSPTYANPEFYAWLFAQKKQP
jgi:predicted peptidase